MDCEICKKEKAKVSVTILDVQGSYPYKTTYRCEACAESAKRSFKVKIEKL
jgi:protein-arginine kinase activator protein McsA